MRYTLLITGIDNPRAKKIVAHNLAGNHNVSLSYAQSMLENVPIVYQTDLLKDDAEVKRRQLTAIGVRCTLVPIEGKAEIHAETKDEAVQQEQAPQGEEVPQHSASTISVSPAVPSFHYKGRTGIAGPLNDETGKKRWIVRGIALLIFLIVAALLYLGNKWRLHFETPAISFTGVDSTQMKKKRAVRPSLFNDNRGSQESRKTQSQNEKLRSNAYMDSGKASFNGKSAVEFYKMAIAINKYNIEAWYSLLATYTALGMDEEVRKTREEMAAIFGEDLFSVSKTIERFGDLLDMYGTAADAFFIEYRSREIESEALIHETFLLAKALWVRKNYPAFSFYAHAAKGSGGGVLVYVAAAPLPGTFQEYRSRAKITVFNEGGKSPGAHR